MSLTPHIRKHISYLGEVAELYVQEEVKLLEMCEAEQPIKILNHTHQEFLHLELNIFTHTLDKLLKVAIGHLNRRNTLEYCVY